MSRMKPIALLPACIIPLFLAACRPSEDAGKKAAAPPKSTPFELKYPLGLQAESAYIPPDNPLTTEKVRLGRRLFFDRRLSADDTISCASCHIPERAFADGHRFSAGVGGRKGARNTPAVINRIFSSAQFWDGRAPSLEAQVAAPVLNPVEMGMPSMAAVVDKIRSDPAYVKEFQEAFPGEKVITEDQVGKAVASFERTILSGNSPYDRFAAGDKTAMSESAQRGLAVFKDENKGNCETCHVSFNFTDENYNNLGVGMASKNPDMGRHDVTKLVGHQGAFKTPTLREVARTPPYMHDGSQQTLEEVIDFYEKGGHRNMWLSPRMKPLKLTRRESADLVEFLRALSGEISWYGKEESAGETRKPSVP